MPILLSFEISPTTDSVAKIRCWEQRSFVVTYIYTVYILYIPLLSFQYPSFLAWYQVQFRVQYHALIPFTSFPKQIRTRFCQRDDNKLVPVGSNFNSGIHYNIIDVKIRALGPISDSRILSDSHIL
jgi:hypothetical protein